ncbi:NAD-dependent epimerase/dehydratase family protein [Pseudonocardia endophytica]|uniref:Nucleoside-diphosphate-sugar epimerase n=1 Tax=Pseudonocardia endophytica TaxID=401976 RepID=A0A4R1HP76_PSEEN|nr:NAD-dependent epimerase/dehydratase family protein [Pseudonocardia endophytica]TCK21529.1 nucleoside-diphosphate-sugar epimerase [Pseudonocardia endophytica]
MTVLVTGGTGFVASWCVRALLERGETVRTTVRDLGREPRVRAAVGEPGDRLEVVAAELLADDGWAEAMKGCTRVLHVASPMAAGDPADPEELIAPAREGAVRVLRAAADAGVPRVVMTSSCAAATPPPGTEGDVDERLWTDPEQAGLDTYRRSKVLAERAAWDAAAGFGGTTLTTVLPGAVFGPILSPDGRGSVEVIGRLLRGMPGAPRIGLNVVDVRDVADLHVRAAFAPEAAGQRYIAVGGFLWMSEVAAELRERLGGQARRVPRRTLPDVALRVLARFRPELGGIVPMLGRRYGYDTTKARTELGWSPRPARTTVVDCARSLIDHGVV